MPNRRKELTQAQHRWNLAADTDSAAGYICLLHKEMTHLERRVLEQKIKLTRHRLEYERLCQQREHLVRINKDIEAYLSSSSTDR